MHTNLVDHGHGLRHAGAASRRWHELLLGAICLLALLISGHAKAAAAAMPAECKAQGQDARQRDQPAHPGL
jgi:polar amino acid transport system substrate-binding protein